MRVLTAPSVENAPKVPSTVAPTSTEPSPSVSAQMPDVVSMPDSEYCNRPSSD